MKELTRRRLPRRRGLSIAKLLLFVAATLLVDCLPLAQTTSAQPQTSRPASFLPLEVPIPPSRPDKDGPPTPSRSEGCISYSTKPH